MYIALLILRLTFDILVIFEFMKKYVLILIMSPLLCFSQNNYISNKDYSAFVNYVRDSLFRQTMGEEIDEENFIIFKNDKNSMTYQQVGVNWKTKIHYNRAETIDVLNMWFYNEDERLNRKRELDVRKLIYNKVKIYPDILVWYRKDSTINKSWATFLSKNYFTHPYFADYPVQGVSEAQLNQYLKWKYPNQNKKVKYSKKDIRLQLPKEKLKITIGEYYKFYKHTRDSIVRRILGEVLDENKYLLTIDYHGMILDPPLIDWKPKLKWKDNAIQEVLKDKYLLTSENKIDNRFVMYDYTYLNYYQASTLPDTINRSYYFYRTLINLGSNPIIKDSLPLSIKKELNNTMELNYKKFDTHQLKAYYHWKIDNYQGKDVFETFIPFSSDIIYEENPNLYMKDNDIELFKSGKLPDSFYNFGYTIPKIVIE